MGGSVSTKLYVELYKWSSGEFPQEYALVYTDVESESDESSIFRLSVSRDKVLCRIVDHLSKKEPVRLHMLVTAARDNQTGDRKFGEVKVVSDGAIDEQKLTQNGAIQYMYGKDGDRPLSHFEVERRNRYAAAENLDRSTWEVCHSYLISTARTTLKSHVSIECDKATGLKVEFSGPYIYKGVDFEDNLGSHIQRTINGEPPKALKALVESEFRGEAFTLFPREKMNNIGVPLICNMYGQNYGSVYHQSHFFPIFGRRW